MSAYPYSVGQEVHSILRATFDAQNVHARQWTELRLGYQYGSEARACGCSYSRALLHDVYAFIVDIRESFICTRGASSQGSVVYSFGVIVQPMISGVMLDIDDMRTLFEQCKPSPSDDAREHTDTRANDEFARNNLVFIIRAYAYDNECTRCIDNMSHSVWTWLGQVRQIERHIPNALVRIVSCGASMVDKVIIREVRALNILVDEYIRDGVCGSPSRIHVPSYIPQIRSPLIHEREQEKVRARMRSSKDARVELHSPLLCECSPTCSSDKMEVDLMGGNFVVHIHPHPC
jgi:hypothetical protein